MRNICAYVNVYCVRLATLDCAPASKRHGQLVLPSVLTVRRSRSVFSTLIRHADPGDTGRAAKSDLDLAQALDVRYFRW